MTDYQLVLNAKANSLNTTPEHLREILAAQFVDGALDYESNGIHAVTEITHKDLQRFKNKKGE